MHENDPGEQKRPAAALVGGRTYAAQQPRGNCHGPGRREITLIPGLTSDDFFLTMNPIVRVVSKVVGCGRMLLIEPDLEAVRGKHG